jgi:hypothetical protein
VLNEENDINHLEKLKYLVVADISFVTLIPAKLKKAMEKTVVQKAVISNGLCANWYLKKKKVIIIIIK